MIGYSEYLIFLGCIKLYFIVTNILKNGYDEIIIRVTPGIHYNYVLLNVIFKKKLWRNLSKKHIHKKFINDMICLM